MKSTLSFLLIITISSAHAKDLLTSQSSRIDAAVNDFFKSQCIAGLAVAISYNNKILFSKGYGFSDIENKRPISPELSMFRIGSVSKSVTSIGLGVLMESKSIDVTLPIQHYLPSFPRKLKGDITTKQLAGHLAGVRHYQGNEFHSNKNYNSVKESLSLFKNDPLVSKPGSQFNYSSYGWNLLSAVMESASKEDFLDFMQNNIWSPLHMTATAADKVNENFPNRTKPYQCSFGFVKNAVTVNNSYKWAAGGFLSSAHDLIRFSESLLTNKLVSMKTREQLWQPMKTDLGRLTNYGYGWETGKYKNYRRIRHDGGSIGGSSQLEIFPDNNLVIILLSNTSDIDYTPFTDEIAAIILEDNNG